MSLSLSRSLTLFPSLNQQIMASEMVGKEMVRIVRNDEYKYPLDDPVAKVD